MFFAFLRTLRRVPGSATDLVRACLPRGLGSHATCECRTGDRGAGEITAGPFRVDRVDDPEGGGRVVRVTGHVSAATLTSVCGAWSDAVSPHLVHIDLSDATIPDIAAMAAFEQAIDHLERRRVDIRIVGLDPTHPALTR